MPSRDIETLSEEEIKRIAASIPSQYGHSPAEIAAAIRCLEGRFGNPNKPPTPARCKYPVKISPDYKQFR